MSLTLATRGSALALWQARTARGLLQAAQPDEDVELLEVRSTGDRDQATALARFGRIGIFTIEVDAAVLDGRAQVGVHSLKDMTTTLQDGVVLAAVMERGAVEDILVGPAGAPTSLAALPPGARVATGSLRRRAMAAAAHPELEFVELRGNVDTRITKLDDGQADALIMARAGFERLGFAERISEVLDTTRFLPAVGQGIVGLTCREDDESSRARLAEINHRTSWLRALAERSVLRELRGGCNVPMGGHATIEGEALVLRARVLSLDGSRVVASEQRVSLANDLAADSTAAEKLGVAAAEELLAGGAAALVEEARA